MQVDLYNRLYRERILFLGQQIDDELANSMIGIMLYLDSEDNNKPINMYINCPGGSVTSGFAMFDTMRHIKSDVSTINVGIAASMGSFLLCGGTKGKRLALPHSRTMIHQPAAGGIQGQASDSALALPPPDSKWIRRRRGSRRSAQFALTGSARGRPSGAPLSATPPPRPVSARPTVALPGSDLQRVRLQPPVTAAASARAGRSQDRG